jgi:alpha-D-ribose 1-methylphosphonate 5-phosphate C-P lyase
MARQYHLSRVQNSCMMDQAAWFRLEPAILVFQSCGEGRRVRYYPGPSGASLDFDSHCFTVERVSNALIDLNAVERSFRRSISAFAVPIWSMGF